MSRQAHLRHILISNVKLLHGALLILLLGTVEDFSDFSDFQHFPTLFGKQLLRDVGLTWFDGLTQKQATSSSSSHQMIYQSFIHVDHFPNRIAMNNGAQ